MLSRIAGRLVTGPGAFFVAGVIDVSLLLVAYLRWLASTRRSTRSS